MTGFPESSAIELQNSQLRSNLKDATSAIRSKRAGVVGEKENWEELRRKAEAIKNEVIENLDSYLQQLEQSVERAGGIVHWASTALEANEIIKTLIIRSGAKEVIKVKSLTTDEMGLNQYLSKHGITALETDLAELIIQLAHDTPSHILVPAIHKNRSEIQRLFQDNIAKGKTLSNDPADLAEAARLYLREKFLTIGVAISGVNFAVSQTGTVCIVESEGNGRMCITLPKLLISVMGIEKLVPRLADLSTLMELLPRSSTGERMNPYTSLWTGVHRGDGPEQFHLVILDNGRSRVLSDPIGRQTLRCIRCSACLNVCPVYERTGGHAYGSVYPGPIGAILSPQLFGMDSSGSLPWASTLCGACYEVCPVRIDIPRVLVHLREKSLETTSGHRTERLSFWLLLQLLRNSKRFTFIQTILHKNAWMINRLGIHNIPLRPLSKWTMSRNLPTIPSNSFQKYRKNQRT